MAVLLEEDAEVVAVACEGMWTQKDVVTRGAEWRTARIVDAPVIQCSRSGKVRTPPDRRDADSRQATEVSEGCLITTFSPTPNAHQSRKLTDRPPTGPTL